MKMLFIPVILCATLVVTSCDKNEGNAECENYNEIIFGHFYGECAGEGCVEMFRIETNLSTLTEDVNDYYPNGNTFYDGNFLTEHPDSKYEAVKDLMDYFPDELLAETETVLGQPDAGDWGGIYFEMKTNDVHRYWLLDQWEGHMAPAYDTFVDKINEKIALINQ